MSAVKKLIKVLYAEDRPADRLPVADFLRAKGCEVTEVSNPDQAIDCLKDGQEAYDVVVLDIVMPEGNAEGGEKVLDNMEQNDIISPVILATAWGYNGPAKRARDAHPSIVREIITKTFLPSQLYETIVHVLKQSNKGKKKRRTG